MPASDLYRREALEHFAKLHQLPRGHVLRATPAWLGRAYAAIAALLAGGLVFGVFGRVGVHESGPAVVHLEDLEVVATLRAEHRDALRPGLPLQFEMRGAPRRELSIRSVEVAPDAAGRAGVLLVRARLASAEAARAAGYREGDTGTAHVMVGTERVLLSIVPVRRR
jgi:hypothetical protein